MNQVNIIGRLGADVDLRYTTTTQRAVAKMSVAVNDRYGATADVEEEHYTEAIAELDTRLREMVRPDAYCSTMVEDADLSREGRGGGPDPRRDGTDHASSP